MAGFFSLGGGGAGGGEGGGGRGNQQQHQGGEIPPPETLYWYKPNDDVSSYHRGFELWNQQQEEVVRPLLQRDLYSSAVGVVVSDDHAAASRSGYVTAAVRPSSSSGEGGISCQDCGNQAKKDCPHMRCRTCCKSRGFDCQTHVKSTWVPAAKRRERQQQLNAAFHRADISKRPRDHHHQINIASPSNTRNNNQLMHSSSGLEHGGNFPALVSSPAEFKCVRVSCVDDADDRYAYQTAVNIGGHVFKGILYDYGPDNNNNTSHDHNNNVNIHNYLAGETSPTAIAGAQPLNLTAAAVVVSSSGALVDPSSLYPAPVNAFMTGSGTQFFPRTRS